jgi:hypothetical protein
MAAIEHDEPPFMVEVILLRISSLRHGQDASQLRTAGPKDQPKKGPVSPPALILSR